MQVYNSLKSFLCGLYRGVSGVFAPIARMEGIELNKFAAAILLAGLIAMVTGKVSQILYHGGEEGEEGAAKRGYTIAGAENAGDAGAPAAEEKPVDIALFLPKGDKAKGEADIKTCQTCHDFTKGGPNKVGPNLWGIVGNKRAHKEDYTYSKTIATMGGTWGYQELSEFIAKPQKYAPGTKMGYAGMKDPQQRADVLAYLQTMSDSPVPFPKPSAPATDAKPAPGAPATPQDKASGEKGTPVAAGAPAETRSGKQTAAEPAKKPEDAAAEAKSKGVPTPAGVGPSSKANTPAPNAATRESTAGKQVPRNGLPTNPADNSQAAADAPAKTHGETAPKAGGNDAQVPQTDAGRNAASPATKENAPASTGQGNGQNLPATTQAPDAGVNGNDTGHKPQ